MLKCLAGKFREGAMPIGSVQPTLEATVCRYFGWEWLDMVDSEVGSCRSYVTGSLGTGFILSIA